MLDVASPPRDSDVIDLSDPSVIDLSAPETIKISPHRWPRPRPRSVVIVAFVAIVPMLCAGAMWLVRIHQQRDDVMASNPQWAAVSAYFEAVQSQDIKRVRATTTDDVVWRQYDADGNPVSGPWRADAYLTLQERYSQFLQFQATGPATVNGDSVAVPVRLNLGHYGSYTAMALLTVRQEGSQLRVSRILIHTATTEQVEAPVVRGTPLPQGAAVPQG